jgi:hypothetical protein
MQVHAWLLQQWLQHCVSAALLIANSARHACS